MDKEYTASDIFKFDKNDISFHMLHKMKLDDKIKDAFNYIISKLPIQDLKPLNELIWDEGKNYNWTSIKENGITLIIRQYRTHFTIFFKKDNTKYNDVYFAKYGCFTIHTNLDKINDNEHDKYIDNEFIDLNNLIKPLLNIIKEGNIGMIWNNYSFIRPKHVDVKNVWNGGDDLTSIDTFIFCCEELFEKYLELFAQTDMLEKLKTIKVGDVLNNKYEVLNVHTKVKDNYYHDAGLTLKGTNGKDSESWNDVYSLTRWYFEDIFTETTK